MHNSLVWTEPTQHGIIRRARARCVPKSAISSSIGLPFSGRAKHLDGLAHQPVAFAKCERDPLPLSPFHRPARVTSRDAVFGICVDRIAARAPRQWIAHSEIVTSTIETPCISSLVRLFCTSMARLESTPSRGCSSVWNAAAFSQLLYAVSANRAIARRMYCSAISPSPSRTRSRMRWCASRSCSRQTCPVCSP